MPNNIPLLSNDRLTQQLRARGITSWGVLLSYIKNLPYGRNANRVDFSLVLSEKKGTCSSKHACLKHLADLNAVPNVSLIMGIYKMNEQNTPGIGTALSENKIEYLPEAHCYLRVNGTRVDCTNSHAGSNDFVASLMEEKEILPEQVAECKERWHKQFIKNWLLKRQYPLEFEAVWHIREQCIQNLSLVMQKE